MLQAQVVGWNRQHAPTKRLLVGQTSGDAANTYLVLLQYIDLLIELPKRMVALP